MSSDGTVTLNPADQLEPAPEDGCTASVQGSHDPEDGEDCMAPAVPTSDPPRCHWHGGQPMAEVITEGDYPLPPTPPYYPLPAAEFELAAPIANPFRVLVLTDEQVVAAHVWLSDILAGVLDGIAWDKHPAAALYAELTDRVETTS
jgi:hypothetical protein